MAHTWNEVKTVKGLGNTVKINYKTANESDICCLLE